MFHQVIKNNTRNVTFGSCLEHCGLICLIAPLHGRWCAKGRACASQEGGAHPHMWGSWGGWGEWWRRRERDHETHTVRTQCVGIQQSCVVGVGCGGKHWMTPGAKPDQWSRHTMSVIKHTIRELPQSGTSAGLARGALPHCTWRTVT